MATSKKQNPEKQRVYLTIDPIFFIIFVVSFLTRYYKLDHPRAVVFDELHYIKFITLYLKRIFFFDPQPPFGKQLLTLVAYWVGFKGDISYSRIGDVYKQDLPIESLRLLPCLFGSLIAPFSYLTALEIGCRQVTSFSIGFLIIFENSLVTQSRFVLLDSIVLFFMILSIYCYLKFSKQGSLIWLGLASLNVTLATCTKYSGFYSFIHLFVLVSYSWWQNIEQLDTGKCVRSAFKYLTCIILIPIVIYVAIYYAHLSWLTKAGPHDTIMTSAFQASLENGLATITRGQPLEIVHGSQITLRHTHGRSCWLHSHEHLYPVKYSDNRGSSHQQQVTCYSFKDVNNWWIVKRPHKDELIVHASLDRIRNGDLVQLVHGITGRTLNSHDVASAMTPYSQEVSCYIDHNISMPAQDLWQIKLVNSGDTDGFWHTLNSQLQLMHFNSSTVLRFSGRQLPEWGFHQHEIVSDKEYHNDDAIWNVEEHKYTITEDQKERELQFGQAEFVPLEPTSLTFFEKFYELHYKLLGHQQETMNDHIYASETPFDWMTNSKGTAYWIDASGKDNAQIFLIGNVSTGAVGLVCIALLTFLVIFYILRRRRRIFTDIDQVRWREIQFQSLVLLTGYSIHLFPYFVYESPLFLHFYLDSLLYKLFIIGVILDIFHHITNRSYIVHGISILILAKSIDTFVKLAPISYGFSMTKAEVEKLRWKDTWQLMILDV